MKKILINCCLINPTKRGMGVYLENIIKELKDLDDFELILVVNNEYASSLIASMQKSNFKTLKVPAPLIFVEQFVIPFFLILYRPSLYINSGNTATLLSFGARYLLLIHDISYTKPANMVPSSNSLKRKLGKFYRRMSIFFKIKKALHVITVSDFAREDIHQQYSFSKNKISMVPNGISTKFICVENSSDDQKRLRQLVFITGTDEQKNMRRVLIALKNCYSNNTFDMETIIVGIGKGFYEYNFDPKVKFIGYQDNENLPRLLASSQFFMLPSLYESFGIPALEAYASGCRLYLSKTGALNSIFGDRAVYFDPWDEKDIEKVLCEMNLSTFFNKSINFDHQFAEGFLWEKSADKLSNLIKKLV